MDEASKAVFHKALAEGYSDSGRERNVLFHGRGDGSFGEVGFATGTDTIEDGCTFAAFDYDRDGDLDLLLRDADPIGEPGPMLQLLRNERGNRKGCLVVELKGKAPNRRALGARVDAWSGGRHWVRELTAGSGYLCQHGHELVIGIGDAKSVERLQVRWPNGETSEFSGISAHSRVVVDQETGGVDIRPLR